MNGTQLEHLNDSDMSRPTLPKADPIKHRHPLANRFRYSCLRWSIPTATAALIGTTLHLQSAGQWVAGTVIPRSGLFAEQDYGFGQAIAFHELGGYTGPGIHHQIAIGAPFYDRGNVISPIYSAGAVWIGNMQFNGVNTLVASSVLDTPLNLI